MIKQILSFSRRHEPELKPLKIASAVMDSIKLLRSTLPSFIEIVLDIQNPESIIEADSIQIHQLMLNLCTNAVHAMEEGGGRLNISLNSTDIEPNAPKFHTELSLGKYVNLKISDNGKGMELEILDHIFEPYFTTKESGKGTGLGLAAVHGIVQSHKGVILVKSQVGSGTEFSIFFPEVIRHVSDAAPESLKRLEGGTGRILVVDDEEDLVTISKTILTHYGYDVVTFTNPLEALDFFSNDPGNFDLVISDMTMPQLTGEKLSENLLNIRPDIPIIICSGYLESTLSIAKERAFNISYLNKPLVVEELLLTVKKNIPIKKKRPSELKP